MTGREQWDLRFLAVISMFAFAFRPFNDRSESRGRQRMRSMTSIGCPGENSFRWHSKGIVVVSIFGHSEWVDFDKRWLTLSKLMGPCVQVQHLNVLNEWLKRLPSYDGQIRTCWSFATRTFTAVEKSTGQMNTCRRKFETRTPVVYLIGNEKVRNCYKATAQEKETKAESFHLG